MRTLLQLILRSHDVRYAIDHWRLTLPMALGAAAGCTLWLLVPNQIFRVVLWIVVVGFGAVVGMAWEKRGPKKSKP